MDVATMMDWAVSRTPEKLAVVDGEKRLTYREWGARVDRLARSLSRLGINKGDRVACMLENSEEHATTFFALQKLGAVATPFNFRAKREGIVYHVNDSGAKMVVFDEDFADEVLTIGESMPACEHYVCVGGRETQGIVAFEELLLDEAPPAEFPRLCGDDPSMILYTSGTTGTPKGVLLTHEASLARALGMMINHGQRHLSDERAIGLMPLFHTVGVHTVLLGTILVNGTYYPVGRFSPAAALDLIERERITYLFGTPTHFQMLLQEDLASRDLNSIEHVLYAGAPMSGRLVRECAGKLTENVTLIYGNTETFNGIFMRRTHERPGAAVCGVLHDVRVVRVGGAPDEVVAPGEEGELIVDMRSPESFEEYWNRPEQTAEKVREGWYHTGDACLFEVEDGRPLYTITGRLDDMIISGGENIRPAEIEDLLASHPGVSDVAVVGMDDPRWGEVVKAFVTKTDPALTEGELDGFFKKSHLENYKRPRSYEFLPEIPRNPSGKILRAQLRAKAPEEPLPTNE